MGIRILDPDVAAKIAAGEVVERAASVVKELVENSLDAGATEISVVVHGGGLDLIRVVDNGTGISADEVELAFERHATSKLSFADDLTGITTLGFRGEALPSISSVSHLSIITRTKDAQFGTFLEWQGGELLRKEIRGSPIGTTIDVSRLFGDVPARLKFIKSRNSESGRVQQVVHQYMLGYPDVRFRLILDSKSPQVSGGLGKLRDVLALYYGSETASKFLEIKSVGEGPITISGLISPPTVTRGNRSGISLVINQRLVQNRSLSFAIEEAYRGFLQIRRYPMAVIFITVPYDDIDVNVHPSKAEVRFRDERIIFSALQRVVRELLLAASPLNTIDNPWPTENQDARHISKEFSRADGSFNLVMDVDARNLTPVQVPLIPKEQLPLLQILGQLHETYIVTEGPDGVYLIDQHAAHERVTYERLNRDFHAGDPSVQWLLEATLVDVPLGLMETISENAKLLERFGFQLEDFGRGSYLVRGVPAVLVGASPRNALLELLEELNSGLGGTEFQERLVSTLACHGSVRAGQNLAMTEMQSLLRSLEECIQPHTCPHGRPTMIHWSKAYLDREFGRR